ncbi:hypothetical protein SDC9_201946 [bioreactor metagenome]|uniref:Uncharacterized protein n=1 Tax=bioreactor metagenome TaxID=1076179 RepID=A0A645IT19_9ZZZZ
MDTIWSTQPSKNCRSWDTRINPFCKFRYRPTTSRACASRWLVGSSISRKRFFFKNKPASRSFVRSPKLKLSKGLCSTSAETSSLFISFTIHSSITNPSRAVYRSRSSPYSFSELSVFSASAIFISFSSLSKGATTSLTISRAFLLGSVTSKGK